MESVIYGGHSQSIAYIYLKKLILSDKYQAGR